MVPCCNDNDVDLYSEVPASSVSHIDSGFLSFPSFQLNAEIILPNRTRLTPSKSLSSNPLL
jgi:hypothetical protein